MFWKINNGGLMFRTGLALAAIVLTTTAGAQAADHAMPATEAVEIAGPVMMVTDLERSLKFYVEGLGLSLGTRLPGNPGPGATVTAREADSSLTRKSGRYC